MAGFAGPIQGSQIKLYHSATIAASMDYAGYDALVTTSTEIKCVTDIGAAESSFSVIEYGKFGEPTITKTAGQSNPADFTFDIAWDGDDPVHLLLQGHGQADEISGTPPTQSYVIAFITTDGSAETLIGFNGWISNFSVAPVVDGIATATVTVSVVTRPTIAVQA